MCDMTLSYMLHESFSRDMTHSYVWHDSFICDMAHLLRNLSVEAHVRMEDLWYA